jgi:hypothetical protein
VHHGPKPRPDICAADADERRLPDRRSGRDRRGSGRRSGETAARPRAYAFRDLDERRDRQDRRLYGIDGTAGDRGGEAGGTQTRSAAEDEQAPNQQAGDEEAGNEEAGDEEARDRQAGNEEAGDERDRTAGPKPGAAAGVRGASHPVAGAAFERPAALPGGGTTSAPHGRVLSLTHEQLRVLLERSEH